MYENITKTPAQRITHPGGAVAVSSALQQNMTGCAIPGAKNIT
jgi:hypothetical protein